MNRRQFLRTSSLALAASTLPTRVRAASRPELRITRILVQKAVGRRLTPVAPNAYAPYRGYDVFEPILRIQTEQGVEGIMRCELSDQLLQKLIGLDPFKLFQFGENDRITGPAEEYKALLTELPGVDIALVDLIGRALKKPAAALLGDTVRDSVQAYDGSVYMEDLLTPDQLKDAVFLNGGPVPKDPVEIVVRKAEWVFQKRPEGFRAFKIKIGRSRWMESPEAAFDRDVAVTHALRKAVGPEVKFMADGNKDYKDRQAKAMDYAEAVAGDKLYFLEEMFPEGDLSHMHEFKKRLRAAGNPVKLAAGESHAGGVPEKVCNEREGREPLVDIDQADMNRHGFLYIRSKCVAHAKRGMTFAPHNFASKMGFYAQVHLGTVVPNWELSEMDDTQIPALQVDGVVIKDGFGKLTGTPGVGVGLKEELLEKPTVDLKA